MKKVDRQLEEREKYHKNQEMKTIESSKKERMKEKQKKW